ncbi:MAG: vitamin K epoxide reductase family protein [Firmicutes bacterium]|nr:vitamin K epoxide reductase family protein [Alicyclobacillaceae bacterium]MCL6497297.1 vitamin K epoxide reductase family protein [Bacillota bacterium]
MSQKPRVRPRQPLPPPRWTVGVEWGALVVMLGITAYLTWAHWAHQQVVCPSSAGGVIHCTQVLTGPGSVVFGLPFAFWGALWAAFGLFWPLWSRGNRWIGTVWEGIGLVALAWALGFEWRDHAVCLWCSAAQLMILLAIGFGRATRPQATLGPNVALWGGGIWAAGLLSLAVVAGQSTAPATTAPAPTGGFALRDLSNRPASLPAGPVVVEVMAPWCEFCATTARWLDRPDAAFAHQKGIGFVLVDASPLGGVGQAATAPTLQSIALTAQDGSRTPLASNQDLVSNLKAFVARYPLPGIPVYFVPLGDQLPASWQANAYPSFVLLNARHQPVAREAGFMTQSQFDAWLSQALPHPKG